MAKSSKLGSKQFFTMSVLAVSVLGLIFVTTAAQKPTNTQSEASGGCIIRPTFTSIGTRSETNYVVYTYKITNPNPITCKHPILYGAYMVTPSSKWSVDYRKNDGEWIYKLAITGSLKSGYSDTIKMRVSPPSSAISKTYNLTAKACEAYSVDYELMPGDNCVSKNLTYTIN